MFSMLSVGADVEAGADQRRQDDREYRRADELIAIAGKKPQPPQSGLRFWPSKGLPAGREDWETILGGALAGVHVLPQFAVTVVSPRMAMQAALPVDDLRVCQKWQVICLVAGSRAHETLWTAVLHPEPSRKEHEKYDAIAPHRRKQNQRNTLENQRKRRLGQVWIFGHICYLTEWPAADQRCENSPNATINIHELPGLGRPKMRGGLASIFFLLGWRRAGRGCARTAAGQPLRISRKPGGLPLRHTEEWVPGQVGDLSEIVGNVLVTGAAGYTPAADGKVPLFVGDNVVVPAQASALLAFGRVLPEEVAAEFFGPDQGKGRLCLRGADQVRGGIPWWPARSRLAAGLSSSVTLLPEEPLSPAVKVEPRGRRVDRPLPAARNHERGADT